MINADPTAPLNIATSALRAQSTAVAVSADNVVNANTPGFQRAEVSFSSVEGGGVQATIDRSTGVQSQLLAGDQSVDLISETVNQTIARTAYEAAAAVFRTSEELLDEAVNLTA
ncbi:MAG: flagellar basal body protein [Magnetovibrionaceae bacterium]